MGMGITPYGGPEEFRGNEIHWGYTTSNQVAQAIGIPLFVTDESYGGSMPTHDLLVACGNYLRTARPEYVFPTSVEYFKPRISAGPLNARDLVGRVKFLYEMCASALWQEHYEIVWG